MLTLNSKCNVFKVMKSVFQGARLTTKMLFIIIISTNRAEIINVQDIKRGFMGGRINDVKCNECSYSTSYAN